MKIDEILKLVNAGYSKEEITAIDEQLKRHTDEKKEQKTEDKKEQKTDEKKDNSFDYDKFAAALVKAQQIANGKTNYGGANDKTDISRFF